MNTIPDLEAFLKLTIFRGPGVEKLNCDKSIDYTRKYIGGDMKNVSPREWIEKAFADPDLPIQYRSRLEMYLSSVRALVAVQGRHGVEETGEWKVAYWHDNPDSDNDFEVEVPFTSKQECLEFIENTVTQMHGKDDWSRHYYIEYESTYLIDGRFDKWGTATVCVKMDELDEIPEGRDVTVYNSSETFRVENLTDKDEILQAAQKALEIEKRNLKKEFVMYKRLIPKGDPVVWGNWWKRIEII